MTLTKADIVNAITEDIGFPRKKALKTVEALLEIIKKSLASDEDVLISGFGKFCVNSMRERRGRSRGSGDSLILAPRMACLMIRAIPPRIPKPVSMVQVPILCIPAPALYSFRVPRR